MTITVRHGACAGCGRPHSRLARRHCTGCYNRHWRNGTHTTLPGRGKTPRGSVVEDYLFLRAEGHDRGVIANRLGMARDTLNQALRRAALDGDTRIDYHPRKATA